jgi:hypothetical protein
MELIIFQFTSISIHVMPSKDLCFIFENGKPIWGGNKDELIKLLKEI